MPRPAVHLSGGLVPDAPPPAFGADEVVLCSAGDGTTSEGEFWESLNAASNLRLPVLYLIQDNGYAISVPVEVQTAGGSISKLVRSFPDLWVREVDGCDFLTSLAALSEAAEWCRARQGPALVHAKVIRPYSHSLSDNEALYRAAAERDADARRDPLSTFPEQLKAEGIATEDDLQSLREAVDREIAGGDRGRPGRSAAGPRERHPPRVLGGRGPHLQRLRPPRRSPTAPPRRWWTCSTRACTTR